MKFKTKVKNSELTVKVKISSAEVLSEREINILNARNIRGFLKPKKIKKNVIVYTGPAGIALNEYLKRPITKYEFYFFMTQIVEATKKLRANELFLNNLLLDLRYVYVNEATKEVLFLYLPMISNHVCLDVLGFMESIIYSIKSEEEAGNSVIGYSNFIKNQNTFEPQAIENYISSEDSNVARQIKRHNLSQSGFITDKPKDYYEHYDGRREDDEVTGLLEEEATSLLEEEEETGLLEEATGLLEEATGLLEDDEATGLLNDNNASHCPSYCATLTRLLTNETIRLNKPVFRIGKERSYVDYFVDGNTAVSRSHADIITRGHRYFICDQGATNHTYVNNEMLPAKMEVEVFDGDTLKLANEEFIFHI